MATDPCISEIIDVANITEKEAKDILDRVKKRKQSLAAPGKIADAEKNLDQLVKEDAERVKLAAALQKKHVALSIIQRRRVEARVFFFVEEGGGLKKGNDYKEAVLAFLYGSHRNIADGRLSINSNRQAILREWVGEGLVVELKRDGSPGLIKALRSDRKLMDDITREMFEIKPNGKRGITGNKDAEFVAGLFSKYSEVARIRLNEAGAFIGKLGGWAPQHHDAARLLKMGEEKWIADIRAALDIERTFPDVVDEEDIIEILSDSFDTITTGVNNRNVPHITKQAGFATPSNLAKSLGKHRVFHFKDADAWLNYRKVYSKGNIMTSILGHLDRSARLVSVMETLGPNPEATLRNVLDSVVQTIKKSKDIDPKLKAKNISKLSVDIGKREGAIGRAFAEVSGETFVPHNLTLAKIGVTVRAVQAISKLGMATISSITDTLTSVIVLRSNGLNLFESYAETFKTTFGGRTSAEQKEIAYLLGATYDGIIEEMANRWQAQDSLPGYAADQMDKFFKLSGLTWWTERHRAGFARTLSAHMGLKASLGFDGLNEAFKGTLSRHGIREKEWGLIRKMKKRAVDKRDYVLPEAVDGLTETDIDTLIADELRATQDALVTSKKTQKAQKAGQIEFKKRQAIMRREAKKKLKTMLMGYFADETDSAVLMSDDRTRAFMLRGTKPGDKVGEVLRFVGQFKSFPIAYTQRILGARRFQQQGKGVDPVGIANIIVGSMVLGYAAMSAKDLLKGKKPRDPQKLATWLAAAVQGGGAGIWGDFLFSKQQRFGGGVIETLAGPTLGSAARTFATVQGMAFGDRDAGDLLRAGLSNTPYINLWYTRAALDYSIMYHIQEMLNPGTLRRRERYIKREFGQEFIPPPSKVIRRGGGFK